MAVDAKWRIIDGLELDYQTRRYGRTCYVGCLTLRTETRDVQCQSQP
jgi:hypothetical protein